MDEATKKLVADASRDVEYLFYAYGRHYREKCESPIEVMLAQAFCAAHLIHCNDAPFIGIGERRASQWHLEPQVQVGSYRVDFLLRGQEKIKGIVIECDGHDFHERTKEQAARDRSRDRDLTLSGYRVLRFTGAEIWKSAWTCAEQVLRAVAVMEVENEQ